MTDVDINNNETERGTERSTLTIPITERTTMLRAGAHDGDGSSPRTAKIWLGDSSALDLAVIDDIYSRLIPAGVSRSVIFRKALAVLRERLTDPDLSEDGLRREADLFGTAQREIK